MYNKMKLFWNRYKGLPFDGIGSILVGIYVILAVFGYDNNYLIIARVVISTIAAICLYLAIKKEREMRSNVGFTTYHFVLICTIFWVIFNGIMFFIK